jgi:predicted transcriptional regulator
MQIPLDRGLIEWLSELAKRMGISQSNMAEILLEQAIEDRQKIPNWIVARFTYTVARMIKGGKRWKEKGGELAYLQVWVEPELMQKIDDMAERIKQVGSKFAGIVLECAVDDYDWMVEAVTTKLSKKLIGFGRTMKEQRSTKMKKEATG